MNHFEDLKIKTQLKNAIDDLGFDQCTPIQSESYSPILSGVDFVGIAQTGTGKTIAYLLPVLQDLKYSEQANPRVLILAPTRELVIQIVEEIEKLTAYMTVRVLGVYGGSSNIKGQKRAVVQGLDIIVGTPRRLYDLAIDNVLRLQSIKKLVIDEVDIMLDFGYKTQLKNIFEYLPAKRQNILFSATMTTYVDELINGFLKNPVKKTISISGTPLTSISQTCYTAPNFYTKANLLKHILSDTTTHDKVLVFMGRKASADRLAETLELGDAVSVIHAGKEQNHRSKSIESFEEGTSRILIATDVIARGIDIEKISTVVSFDTPMYPENYIHRIGRTGRANELGNSILFYSEKEQEQKNAIEDLMNYKIPFIELPPEVEINPELTPEERPKVTDAFKEELDNNSTSAIDKFESQKANKKKQQLEEIANYQKSKKQKYKKPQRRGDKILNMKKKKRKR